VPLIASSSLRHARGANRGGPFFCLVRMFSYELRRIDSGPPDGNTHSYLDVGSNQMESGSFQADSRFRAAAAVVPDGRSAPVSPKGPTFGQVGQEGLIGGRTRGN